MHKRISTYSDGGARGNPGPAAAAFLILSGDGKTLKAEAHCLGKRTNNQAEYEALIAALEFAANLKGEEVTCFLDSELVAKHLSGEYHVRNPDLCTLWKRVQEIKRCFKRVQFVHVLRTNRYIQEADRLVNEALDQAAK
jgi:ribonuclease HI